MFVIYVPSEAESVRAVRDHLDVWLGHLTGLDADDRYDLVSAVAELVANAVEHPVAPAGSKLSVAAAVDGDAVVVTVTDQGQWNEQAPGPDRGRGLVIVDAFVDDRTIEHSLGGTSVNIRKRLSAGAPP